MNSRKNFASAFMSNRESQKDAEVQTEEAAVMEACAVAVVEVPPKETKTRRVQLLLTQSEYAKVKEAAQREHCSVNRFIEAMIANLP